MTERPSFLPAVNNTDRSLQVTALKPSARGFDQVTSWTLPEGGSISFRRGDYGWLNVSHPETDQSSGAPITLTTTFAPGSFNTIQACGQFFLPPVSLALSDLGLLTTGVPHAQDPSAEYRLSVEEERLWSKGV